MIFVKATVSKEVQLEARLQIIKECLKGKAVEIAGVDYSWIRSPGKGEWYGVQWRSKGGPRQIL